MNRTPKAPRPENPEIIYRVTRAAARRKGQPGPILLDLGSLGLVLNERLATDLALKLLAAVVNDKPTG